MPWNEGGGGEPGGYGTIRNPAREGGIGDLGTSRVPCPWVLVYVGVWAGRWAMGWKLDRDIRGAVRKPCEEEELAVPDFAVSSMSCMPVEPTDMKVPAKC